MDAQSLTTIASVYSAVRLSFLTLSQVSVFPKGSAMFVRLAVEPKTDTESFRRLVIGRFFSLFNARALHRFHFFSLFFASGIKIPETFSPGRWIWEMKFQFGNIGKSS